MSYNVGQTVIASLTFVGKHGDHYELCGKSDYIYAEPADMLENQPECLRLGNKVNVRGLITGEKRLVGLFKLKVLPGRESIYAELWIRPEEIISVCSQPALAPIQPTSKFQVGDKVWHVNMPGWGHGTITKIASSRDNALDYTRPNSEYRHFFDGPWYHVQYANRSGAYISAEDLLTTTPPTKFQVGDAVFQANCPEWGVGTVDEVVPGPRLANDYIKMSGDVVEFRHFFAGPWYKVSYPNKLGRYISAEDLLKPGAEFVPPAKFEVGDTVIQINMPSWGVGIVVEVIPGPRTAKDFIYPEGEGCDEMDWHSRNAWYKVQYALRDKRYISAEEFLTSAGI